MEIGCVCVAVTEATEAGDYGRMPSRAMMLGMICHSNMLCCAQGYAMEHIHGLRTGGWWCYTNVDMGVHSYCGAVHPSVPFAVRLYVGARGPHGGALHRPCGIANPPGHDLCWLDTTLQCLLLASSGRGIQHAQVP